MMSCSLDLILQDLFNPLSSPTPTISPRGELQEGCWEQQGKGSRVFFQKKKGETLLSTTLLCANKLLPCCATDMDGWRMKDLFQRIFLSSDPENEAIKELVYDCLYLPWLKGEFISEFAPEWADPT